MAEWGDRLLMSFLDPQYVIHMHIEMIHVAISRNNFLRLKKSRTQREELAFCEGKKQKVDVGTFIATVAGWIDVAFRRNL